VVVENRYQSVVSEAAELTVRLPAFGTLAFTQGGVAVTAPVGTVTLEVARTGGSDGAVSVDYRLAAGGTATEGQEFTFAAAP
jgi:hypothetical protein